MVRPFNQILTDDEDLVIEYSFSSSVTDESSFYNTCILASIFLEDYSEPDKSGHYIAKRTQIGTMELRSYNFMQCINDHASLDDIPYNRDDDYFLSHFFDWLHEDYNDFWYDNEILGGNILSISRLELYPKYRCKGYGRLVIQDVFNRFYGSFELLALIAFPLQFEACADKDSNEFKAMKYEMFKGDFKQSQQKLFKFYRSLGFTRYKRTNLFYISSDYRNEKLEGRPI